jgi:flagellar hook-associated protein 2
MISSFGLDFEQVIERAVGIASLPLTQLRAQKSVLTTQTTSLDSITESFTALRTALTGLDTTLTADSHVSTVSDETIARVNLNGNVLPADYTVEVLDVGARTLTLSLDGLPPVADPFNESVSAATDFTLSVDGADYVVTPASGSLFDLATAINNSGAGVQATVVNVGGAAGADYRLSIQSEKFAGVAIQLNDGGQDLLQTLSTGAPVIYTVNGVPGGGISADSRTVTLSPGVSVDLLKVGTTDISVSKNASSAGDALAAFVTAYNETVGKLDLHRGTNGGSLGGQFIVSSLSRSLANVIGYNSGSGNIRTLADLGVRLDDTGRLTLDRTVLDGKEVGDVLSFLGNSTAGFLQTASAGLATIDDTSDGLLALEMESMDRQIERQNKLIASNEDRIETMRENLLARMSAADAVIAVLEQQAIGIQGLFDSFNANKVKK